MRPVSRKTHLNRYGGIVLCGRPMDGLDYTDNDITFDAHAARGTACKVCVAAKTVDDEAEMPGVHPVVPPRRRAARARPPRGLRGRGASMMRAGTRMPPALAFPITPAILGLAKT